MAYAFYAAEGKTLPEGAKKPSPEDVGFASEILREAKKNDIPVILPEDFNENF